MNKILRHNKDTVRRCGRQCYCFNKLVRIATRIPVNDKEQIENNREFLYEVREQLMCPNYRRVQESLPSK